MQLTAWTAFGAGALTFFTPCVLPLLPVYVSFVTGLSVEELRAGVSGRALLASVPRLLVFIAGFTAVFVALGASASFVGALLWNYRDILMRAIGAVIVVFGLHMSGLVTIPALNVTRRLDATRFRNSGWLFPLAFGIAFALSWSGCTTPILAPILTLAARADTVAQGAQLLLAYSLGLAVPFVVTGVAFPYAIRLFSRNMRFIAALDRVAGALLVVFGLLLLWGRVSLLHSIFPS